MGDGEYSLRFTFDGYRNKVIYDFARHEEYTYAATGSPATVLRSSDHKKWDTFVSLDDNEVRSLGVYKSALFMGTGPSGYIYVFNFTGDGFYLFVETRDHAVTCMTVHKDRLWAGTSPGGYVYSFDGTVWREEFNAYGRGITSMTSAGDNLYVFSEGAETGACWDGDKWGPMEMSRTYSNNSSMATISSYKHSIGETLGTPITPEHNISASESDQGNLLLGGENGAVFSFDPSGEELSRLYQSDSGKVSAIANIGSSMNLAAIGNKIYLLDGNEDIAGGNDE